MILKKPYALLIKAFRPIHFILALLIGYMSFNLYGLYDFLKEYLSNGYYSFETNLAAQYLPIFMYIAILIILILTITMIMLLTFKKKPTLLYWFLSVCFIFSFFFIIITRNNLQLLEQERVNLRILLIARDISLGLFISQFVLGLYTVLRALGFDLKKFEFGKDIKELNIETADNEEFEFYLDVDKETYITKLRKKVRYTKYYIGENIRVITTVGGITLAIVLSVVLYSTLFKNKVYREGQSIEIDNIIYKVEKSYILSKDNPVITSDDKKVYAVIRINAINKKTTRTKLDRDRIQLQLNEKTYSPNVRYYESFKDIGKGYNDQNIGPNEDSTYILVYEVDGIASSPKLTISGKEDDKSIKLKPEISKESNLNRRVKLNEKLHLGESVLSKSTVQIQKYEFNEMFTIEEDNNKYQIKLDGTNENVTLMRLNIQLEIPEELNLSYMSNWAFIKKYATLKYQINNKEKTTTLVNKTPVSYKGNNLYFEVNENIKEADKIYFDINIRGQRYIYNFK